MKPLADGNYRRGPQNIPNEPPDTVDCPTCEGAKEVTIFKGDLSYKEECSTCKGEGEVAVSQHDRLMRRNLS